MIGIVMAIGKTWLMVSGAVLVLLGVVLFIAAIKKRKELVKSKPEHVPQVEAFTVSSSSIIGDRSSQQDSFFVPDNDANGERIFIVCDGMGGLSGGERASALCVQTMREGFYANAGQLSPLNFYRQYIPICNKSVQSLCASDGKRLNAGTTLVAAIIKENKAYVASVGDSRVYIYREGKLLQVTRDHNYKLLLDAKVSRGEMTAAQAENDPQREALISYIGINKLEIIDATDNGISLLAGDVIILCSDGLYKSVTAQELMAILANARANPETLAQTITSTAYAMHSSVRHDNITVVSIVCNGVY